MIIYVIKLLEVCVQQRFHILPTNSNENATMLHKHGKPFHVFSILFSQKGKIGPARENSLSILCAASCAYIYIFERVESRNSTKYEGDNYLIILLYASKNFVSDIASICWMDSGTVHIKMYLEFLSLFIREDRRTNGRTNERIYNFWVCHACFWLLMTFSQTRYALNSQFQGVNGINIELWTTYINVIYLIKYFQIKTLKLAILYINYLVGVIDGDQDPKSGFQAELKLPSRKIYIDRKANEVCIFQIVRVRYAQVYKNDLSSSIY